MENASKALVMAGGILIALLVIGALLLMFNQLSDYQKSGTTLTKTSQLTDFNKEFVQFTYDNIKGYDLITLVNKVVDYNKKSGIGNSVNYEEKISLTIDITKFKNKYGTNGKLQAFTKNSYTIKDGSDELASTLAYFSGLESTYTIATMSKLSANYDSIKLGDKTIKDVTGKDINISSEEIEKYREYSEFKSSTFASDGEVQYYPDGQIKSLLFKFVK